MGRFKQLPRLQMIGDHRDHSADLHDCLHPRAGNPRVFSQKASERPGRSVPPRTNGAVAPTRLDLFGYAQRRKCNDPPWTDLIGRLLIRGCPCENPRDIFERVMRFLRGRTVEICWGVSFKTSCKWRMNLALYSWSARTKCAPFFSAIEIHPKACSIRSFSTVTFNFCAARSTGVYTCMGIEPFVSTISASPESTCDPPSYPFFGRA